jgi:geranylgeranyl diphosphate synthase, type I
MMLEQLESLIDVRLVTQTHKLLIQMSKEIVVGQHLDMEYTTRTDVPEAEILRRHHLKTSLYTFIRPMQIGTTLAGADGPVLKFCEEFGTELGLGFQLEDDLLDILGEEAALGKRLGSDLSQRQHTLLTSDFRKRADAAQRARFESYWGHELSADQLRDVKTMFEETGTFETVRAKARTAFTAAGRALENSPLPADVNSALSELLTFFVHRLP